MEESHFTNKYSISVVSDELMGPMLQIMCLEEDIRSIGEQIDKIIKTKDNL